MTRAGNKTAPKLKGAEVPREVLFAQNTTRAKKTVDQRELVPLVKWYGDREARYYNPDDLVERKGLEIYDKMGKDDQVWSATRIKTLSRLATGWEFNAPDGTDAQDKMIRQFVVDTLTGMPGGLDAKLEQYMTAQQYGFSVAEKVWKIQQGGPWDGKVVYHDIKPKSPMLFNFVTDPYGNITENGIELVNHYGSFKSDQRFLPRDKMVIWSYNQRFGNPYGTSDYRPAFRSYYSKDFIIKLFNLHIEKFASPTAMAFLPDNLAPEEIEHVQKVLGSIQSLTSATFPEGVEVKYMESRLGGAIAFKFQDAIDMHNRFIARAILVPDSLGYSGGTGGGSFALGKRQIDVFFMVLTALARDIQETLFSEQIIKPLVRLNFPNVERFPVFKFRDVEDDLAIKTKIMDMLFRYGAVDPAADWIRSYIKLPDYARLQRPQLQDPRIPATKQAVFTALRQLSASHGVFVRSLVCPFCHDAASHAVVFDQRCKTVYHQACMDQLQGRCCEQDHRDHLLAADLTARGDVRAYCWQQQESHGTPVPLTVPAELDPEPEEPALDPEPDFVHRGGPHEAGPLEWATNFRRIGITWDKVQDDAVLRCKSVFSDMRDKLVALIRKRQIVARRDMEAVQKLSVNPGDLQQFLHGFGLTMAGNGAVEAALEIKRKAARTRAFADDSSPELSAKSLPPKQARQHFTGQSVETKLGTIRIDLSGFLDSFFSGRAFTLAGIEKEWITNQARMILENAIRQGDPRAAEEQIIQLFDAYIGRGGTGRRPGRLWNMLGTFSGEAFNEGRRSIFDHPDVKIHVVAYQWSSILDARTTEYCNAMHGRVFRPEQMATQFPPAHYLCRSTCVAVFEYEDFKLSDGDPISPKAGIMRQAGFTAGASGETLSVLLWLRPEGQLELQPAQDWALRVMPGLTPPDDGGFHITLAHCSGLTSEQADAAVEDLKAKLEELPITLDLGPMEQMVNADGETVVYLAARDEVLSYAATIVRDVLQLHGAQFQYPEFKGHVTLGYGDLPLTPQERATMQLVEGRRKYRVVLNLQDAVITRKSGGQWVECREQ